MTRKPTFVEAIIPLVAMVLILGIGYGYLRLPTQALLIMAAAVSAVIAMRVGLTWQQMFEGIAERFVSSLTSMFVMICVGGLIASWMISGTIPLMIYYGVKIINQQYLFVTAFLVTAVISTFTGTSFGSAGTAGVAIMGVAYALGLPLEIAAGAVISGAVFGDKLSPLSDTTILAPIAAGADLYDHIKHLLYTTGAATILSLIVFTVVGMRIPANDMANPQTVTAVLTNLETLYNLTPILLIPPVIVFWGAYVKKPTIPILLLSSLVALVLGVIFQDFSVKTAVTAFVNGFNVNLIPLVAAKKVTVVKEIATLLNRGGMMGMMSTILLILCAFSFAGIFSKAGCIEVIIEKMLSSINSVGNLIASTVASTLFMSIVTGSSYLAILIPGEMFKATYAKWNLAPKNLSRTLEDAGTCAVPIVPWAIAGTYMANTLGVPTLSYMPWAILCYSSFVFAIIFGYTGFSIAKLDKK